jgi:hypothetical protein
MPKSPIAAVAAITLIATFTISPARAEVVEAEAVVGQPWGVGRVVVDLPDEELPLPLRSEGLGLRERNNRVFFPTSPLPAFAAVAKQFLGEDTPLTAGGPVREEIGGVLRGILDRPPRTTIYFLFRGDEPLDLVLEARHDHPLTVTPRERDKLHRRWSEAWWKRYSASAGLLAPKPDYPPLVENFLVTTLARQLDLRLPKAKQTKPATELAQQEIGLFLGSSSLRMALEQDRQLGLTNLSLPTDRPLPPAIAAPPLELPDVPADVKIEPIAAHVPPECFYVRFGSYANFLWMQDTLDTWGGDLQNLVALRGLDRGLNHRIQSQLVLQRNKLTDWTGGLLISDVAIIGNDLFFDEGAAYGFLFEARNASMLINNFNNDRSARLSRGGVEERKLKIAGHDVSLLVSADGSVRSYFVVSGDYLLFSSCEALVRRFLETAEKGDSLGRCREFKAARLAMPLARDDSVFAYFSDAFFRNLTGPRYRIEMMRRLEAVADIEVVELARLLAAAEGRPGDTIQQLVRGGMLAPDFGPRPDGSRTVLADGKAHDSLRGYRGAILPVPDVPVARITAAEEAAYRQFAATFAKTWGRIDPLVIGVSRQSLPENRERVVLDARMIPFADRHVQLLQRWAGPADTKQMVRLRDDIAAAEFVMPQGRLFAGLRDLAPPLDTSGGHMTITRLRDCAVGYLGAIGDLGPLMLVNATVLQPADPDGYSRNVLGLWRRQFHDFTVFSFQREVLEAVTPKLQLEPSPQPAQIRVRVGDPSRARITPTINSLGFARTRETSLGNLRLLHSLVDQLHVPPERARDTAESLLGAKLLCPLGGSYELKQEPGGTSRWTAASLEQPAALAGGLLPTPPAGYTAPPLNWFRGLNLDAIMASKTLTAHADVVMQLPGR